MSIKTATLNGVATIEIARPEKKNALTVAMYQAMADALNAARADAAVRAVLITGQPGIFTSGNDIEDFMHARRRRAATHRLAGVPLHARAARLRQAGGGRRHRRGHRHRHHDAAALRLRLRVRRGAPGDALREPGPGARVRVQPGRAAADGPRAARPRSCCSATRSRAEQAVECGIANAVLPAGEVVNHARRVAERFNALPPGAVREAKQLMRAPAARAIAADHRAPKARSSPSRLRSPEAHGSLPGLLPEAQARLLASSAEPARRPCRSPLKLALSPAAGGAGGGARAGALPRLPEAAGARAGRGRPGARGLRLLIAGRLVGRRRRRGARSARRWPGS